MIALHFAAAFAARLSLVVPPACETTADGEVFFRGRASQDRRARAFRQERRQTRVGRTTYSGLQAEAMHLANFCFADERFDAELERLSADILCNSWYANQVNKRALIEIDGLSLQDAHSLELFKNEGLAPDAARRVAKFFARREPPG